MESPKESIIQKILNFKFSVRQRLRYHIVMFGIGVVWKLIKMIISYRKHRKMLQKIKQYNQARWAQINALKIPLPNFSQEKLESILNASVAQLKEMLKKNEVSSEDLVNIFSHRCREIGLKQYFCITDFDYERAIEYARHLDQKRLENPNIVDTQPLYGVPVSIKDFFDIKGLPTTMGCGNRLNRIPEDDGLSVKLIKISGGIPFVKTNVPQLGMSFETANRIYGRTLNPWDQTRYSGGSSGGEAVCVATRCSPLGLGTDFGGSIRSPASFNGLFGFKPTSGRIPLQVQSMYAPTQRGESIVKTSIGPLCKNVDDCILLMEALNHKELMNIKLHEGLSHQVYLPFDQEQLYGKNQRKIKIGYLKNIEEVDATLANQRAVQMTVDCLRELGHELVEIQIPSIERLTYIFYQLCSMDGLKGYEHQLGDEEYLEVYKPLIIPFYCPSKIKKLIQLILKLSGEKRTYKALSVMNQQNTAADYLTISDEVQTLKKQVLKYYEDQNIEAIVMPCFAAPPLKHKNSSKIGLATSYLYYWNVLNFPAGVLPVTEVREDEQHYNNSKIKDKMAKTINEDMKGSAKLPINVQIITLPNKDELCLNLMKQVDDKIQFYKNRKLPV